MRINTQNNIFLSLILLLSSIVSSAQVTQYDDDYTIVSDSLLLQSIVESVANDSYQPPTWAETVDNRLQGLLQNDLFETSQVALMVYDLTADSIVFKHNERQLLRPASTQKMITAVTALDLLGSDYCLTTRLCYTGEIVNNTLFGNIYCIGAMDPLFDSADMRYFAESIRSAGIDTIRGKIVADLSMKDGDRLGEGWCWDDKNPTLTPLLFNGKDNFMPAFLSQLEYEGIYIDASCDEGSAPHSATMLCERSHSITQVMDRMMKKSDNLYAEAVFYQIAFNQGGRHSTAKNAANAIKRLINRIGLNASDYRIADGSGLSLYNYTTVEAEVKLLKYAWQNRNIYYYLYDSMPIAGVDGTLQSRMKGTLAANNVRAKTGTVTGVSSLTGYCTASNGHELCFSIINNGMLSASRGRAFQDAVCIELCQ